MSILFCDFGRLVIGGAHHDFTECGQPQLPHFLGLTQLKDTCEMKYEY